MSPAALAAAALADADLAAGNRRGPLHGVPLAHKDMYYRRGRISACGSKIRADFVPKPDPKAFDALVRHYRLNPPDTVMVEDLARNLEPAAALGMTTVWIKTESEIEPNQSGENVDHVVDDLAAWLAALTAG